MSRLPERTVAAPVLRRLVSSRALVAAAVIACSPLAQAQLFGSKKPEPVVVNQAEALPSAGTLFTTNGSATVPKRLVLGSFAVEFSTAHAMKASQSSGLGQSANQTLEYHLVGMEPQHFQALADAAYNAFLEEARTAGFEVVGKDELVANPVYKAAVPAGKPSGMVKDGAGLKLNTFAPSGMVLNGIGIAPGISDYNPGGATSMLGGLGAVVAVANVVGSTAEAISSISPMANIGESLGGARLVQMRLSLYFAELNGEFGKNASMLQAGVRGKVGLYVDPRNTQIHVMTEDGKSGRTYTLKQPLLIQGNPFTGSEDVSPTGSNMAVAAFSAMLGGNTSSRTSRFNIKADPAQYNELAAQGLKRTASLVFGAMKAE
jgi:hypothetical protein